MKQTTEKRVQATASRLSDCQYLLKPTPEAKPDSPSTMQAETDETARITFSEQCPVTKMHHAFTCTHYVLLSGERLEAIATKIRYSTATELGLCESRSRALTEMIFKVIAWEKGLVPEHPLIPNIGSYPGIKKRKASSPLQRDNKEE